MKTFLLFTILTVCLTGALAVVNNNIKLLVRPRLKQCAAKLGVNDKDLDAVINNDLSNTSTPMQCLALCFFEELHIMDSQGNFKPLIATVLFSAGESFCKVTSVVRTCQGVKGANACNTAFLLNKCFVDNGLL